MQSTRPMGRPLAFAFSLILTQVTGQAAHAQETTATPHAETTSANSSSEEGPAALPPAIRLPTDAERVRLEALGQTVNAALSKHAWAEVEMAERESLRIHEDTFGPEHPETIGPLAWLARALFEQGQYEDADPVFRRALAIEEATAGANTEFTRQVIPEIAANLQAAGRYPEAEAFGRRALQLAEATFGPGDESTATALNDLAFFVWMQGRPSAAEPLYRRAYSLYQKLAPDSSHTPNVLLNLASVIGEQGDPARAEPVVRRALAMFERNIGTGHPHMAVAYGQYAGVLEQIGRDSDAQFYRSEAVKIWQHVFGPQDVRVNDAFVELADNLRKQGRLGEAARGYRLALDIYATRKFESDGIGEALHGLGLILNEQGRYRQAEALLREALAKGASASQSLAVSLAGQGRHAEALPFAERLLTQARSQRAASIALGEAPDYLGSELLLYLAVSHVEWKRSPDQRPHLRATAFTAAQDLQRGAAGTAAALAAARTAADPAGLGSTIRARQDAAVQARAESSRLLRALAADDAAGAEQIRSRLDQWDDELQRLDAEIRDKFPRYSELASPLPLEITEAQRRLGPREGLLLIAPAGEDVHVFAISANSVVWHRRERAAASDERRVRQLRCEVDSLVCGKETDRESRGAKGAYERALSQEQPQFDATAAFGLYRDILRPVEHAFARVDTLLVAANGPLSSLPLGMLVTQAPKGSAEPQWLADRYALISLPSVSSLRILGVERSPDLARSLTGFGNPVLAPPGAATRTGAASASHLSRQRLDEDGIALADVAELLTMASLPETETELRTMASALGAPASAVHLGPAATETAVKTSADLSQARVVIFATHGLLPRELKGLEEPGLVFTPPATATAEDDGVLTASEAARLNLSADWVILSACNTAAADGTPGAESLSGLAKAFLYAGAQALLASHWRVADDSTSVLTVQTLAIQKANPGFSKAQALQAAMKAVRTGKLPDGSPLPGWKPQWAHPAAWAPFTLVSAGG